MGKMKATAGKILAFAGKVFGVAADYFMFLGIVAMGIFGLAFTVAAGWQELTVRPVFLTEAVNQHGENIAFIILGCFMMYAAAKLLDKAMNS